MAGSIRPGNDEIGLVDGWRRWRARLLGSGRGESRHDGEDGRHDSRRWLSSSSAQPTRVRKEKGRKNGHGLGERDKDASAHLCGERGSTPADAWSRRWSVAAWARYGHRGKQEETVVVLTGL